MDGHTRRALVEKYKDGYWVVSQALQGISEQELDARPAPGKWSAREIVHAHNHADQIHRARAAAGPAQR